MALDDAKKMQAIIKENENNLIWLGTFVEELDKVLAI